MICVRLGFYGEGRTWDQTGLEAGPTWEAMKTAWEEREGQDQLVRGMENWFYAQDGIKLLQATQNDCLWTPPWLLEVL